MAVDQFARMLAMSALYKSDVPFTEEEKQKLADLNLDEIAAMQNDIKTSISSITENQATMADMVDSN